DERAGRIACTCRPALADSGAEQPRRRRRNGDGHELLREFWDQWERATTCPKGGWPGLGPTTAHRTGVFGMFIGNSVSRSVRQTTQVGSSPELMSQSNTHV